MQCAKRFLKFTVRRRIDVYVQARQNVQLGVLNMYEDEGEEYYCLF
jgi:hypothetical protein